MPQIALTGKRQTQGIKRGNPLFALLLFAVTAIAATGHPVQGQVFTHSQSVNKNIVPTAQKGQGGIREGIQREAFTVAVLGGMVLAALSAVAWADRRKSFRSTRSRRGMDGSDARIILVSEMTSRCFNHLCHAIHRRFTSMGSLLSLRPPFLGEV